MVFEAYNDRHRDLTDSDSRPRCTLVARSLLKARSKAPRALECLMARHIEVGVASFTLWKCFGGLLQILKDRGGFGNGLDRQSFRGG